jgi:hypothetical protein
MTLESSIKISMAGFAFTFRESADDTKDVVSNVISFEGICQIRPSDLFLANRAASLSVVGWCIFVSFARTVMTRANPREVELRMALE